MTERLQTPQLTPAERDAAAEPHVVATGLRCVPCGLDFLPAYYDAHLEASHARGVTDPAAARPAPVRLLPVPRRRARVSAFGWLVYDVATVIYDALAYAWAAAAAPARWLVWRVRRRLQ